MSGKSKKIISIFLMVIIFISQISIIFANESTGAESKSLQTLESYLIENRVDADKDGILSNTEWEKVKHLHLNGNEVDITGIEKAVNLKELALYKYYDLEKIDFSKLSNLNEVLFQECDITGIDFGDFSNVRDLVIMHGDIRKIDFTKLVNLEYLSIEFCDLNGIDFTCLSNISNLKSLSLWTTNNCLSKNIELDLSSLKQLESLYIYDESAYEYENGTYIYNDEINNWITKLNISELSNLKYLHLYGMECCDINLPRLDNIEDICIGNDKNLEIDLTKSKNLYVAEFSYCLNNSLNEETIKLDEDMMVLGNDYSKGIRIIIKEDFEMVKGAKVEEKFFIGEGVTVNVETSNIIEKNDSKLLKAVNIGSETIKCTDFWGREHDVSVTVFENNPDTTLETSDIVNAKIIGGNTILKSNGELWKVNSETLAEKIDTNVKEYEPGSRILYETTLYK